MNHTERADESRETDAAAGGMLRALAIFATIFLIGLAGVLYAVDYALKSVMGL